MDNRFGIDILQFFENIFVDIANDLKNRATFAIGKLKIFKTEI